MNELTKTDLAYVVRRLPKDVADMLRQNSGLFIGGGFIRETISGGEVQDIDVFGPSMDALYTAARQLKTDRESKTDGPVRFFSTNNAATLLSPPRLPVQFITRWVFANAESLASSFDFTVCRAAIWYQDGMWRSVAGDGFYADLAARRLVYCYPVRDEEAGGSMMRVVKFLRRGYSIQPESLGGAIARCSMRMDRLIRSEICDGTEKGRGEHFGKMLREVDPLSLVDGLEPINEHDTSLI